MKCPKCKGVGRLGITKSSGTADLRKFGYCKFCPHCYFGYVTLWRWIKLKLGISK